MGCFWFDQVKMMSSLTGEGLPEVWASMTKYRDTMVDNDQFVGKRAAQRNMWMWNYINDRLLDVRVVIYPSEAEIVAFFSCIFLF